ncbi:hypothetical protein LSTR_LSTR006001 [Laodelphax striatellus]|uniref:Sushi domain-containing protein n=1 Tax=Laodelphax striatellus TaxID=195883 RepID=A0A482XQD5_LAOST|nr:hypothetical protein LSTR_LSTR006001 [Laodelphax striatellus]
MERNKHNLNMWWRKLGTFCLLFLLPIPSDSHNSMLHTSQSLVEHNIAEAFEGVDTGLLGDCSKLLRLSNVRVNMTSGEGGRRTLHFSCAMGYRLLGPPKLLCPPEKWQMSTLPYCEQTGCKKLPLIMNGGELVIGGGLSTGDEGEEDLYPEGVVVEYQCESGYRLVPMTSQRRVCRQGQWTGSAVSCVFDGCARMDHPDNGYIEEPDQLLLPAGDYGHVRPGARLLFKCNEGFELIGPPLAVCQPSGQWQPSATPPICRPRPLQQPSRCVPPSPVIQIFSESGEKVDLADEGAVVQMGCALGYRDKTHGCKMRVMRCAARGQWQGGRSLPQCIRAQDCVFPPKIEHAQIEQIEGGVGAGRFGIGAQVTYACLEGYQLSNGDASAATLTCTMGGCWQPSQLPYCEQVASLYLPNNQANWPSGQYFGASTANTSLLFSIVTALGILFVLLSVCVAQRCTRGGGPGATGGIYRGPPPESLAANAAALPPPSHDPDRVALIALADGIQQSGLPTYEEAMRSSAANPMVSSRHRAYHGGGAWSSVIRRDRDEVASDTTSSTGVLTLDTVSCHTCTSSTSSSGQTASCRAICGSLASFDTSSVHNTEGVPLLEENELEESGIALMGGMEGSSTPPACDNTSFKLQSADIDSIHS